MLATLPCARGRRGHCRKMADRFLYGAYDTQGRRVIDPRRRRPPGGPPAPNERRIRYFPVNRAPRISFVSLGCPKALVDSERIMTRLRAEGYELAREPRRCRSRHRQYLRLSRQRAGGIADGHRRRARRERQGHRHRLHGRGAGKDHGRAPERARGHRAAAIRKRARRGPSRGSAAARSLYRTRFRRRASS